METTCDPGASGASEGKHGVPPTPAEAIDWSPVCCAPDDRNGYSELREMGYAVIDAHLCCVAFTQGGETFRVISLRKANNREMDRNEQATQIDPQYP
jgi:uncharacterized protein